MLKRMLYIFLKYDLYYLSFVPVYDESIIYLDWSITFFYDWLVNKYGFVLCIECALIFHALMFSMKIKGSIYWMFYSWYINPLFWMLLILFIVSLIGFPDIGQLEFIM